MMYYAILQTQATQTYYSMLYSFSTICARLRIGDRLVGIQTAKSGVEAMYRLSQFAKNAQNTVHEPRFYSVITMRDVDNIKPKLVFSALLDNGWNQSAAARQLGVSRKNINNYCSLYGFKNPEV